MNETIWSRYEAGQYADTPQNWKHLQARKGQFQEIHPGYYAAKDGFDHQLPTKRHARCSLNPLTRSSNKINPIGLSSCPLDSNHHCY